MHEVLNVHPSFLECQKCKESIKDRYLLRAMDKYWHEDCLACDLCQCRLGEVGCNVYTKLGRKLCHRDYLRYVKLLSSKIKGSRLHVIRNAYTAFLLFGGVGMNNTCSLRLYFY